VLRCVVVCCSVLQCVAVCLAARDVSPTGVFLSLYEFNPQNVYHNCITYVRIRIRTSLCPYIFTHIHTDEYMYICICI